MILQIISYVGAVVIGALAGYKYSEVKMEPVIEAIINSDRNLELLEDEEGNGYVEIDDIRYDLISFDNDFEEGVHEHVEVDDFGVPLVEKKEKDFN